MSKVFNKTQRYIEATRLFENVINILVSSLHFIWTYMIGLKAS